MTKANIARINDNAPLIITRARLASCTSRVNANTTCSAPVTTKKTPNNIDATMMESFGQASTAAPNDSVSRPDASIDFWDRGTYTNDSPYDMAQGLRRGHLSFQLNGERLRGGYALTRIRGGVDETWLLVKKSDEYADARRNQLRSHPQSVVSGRTLDEPS